MDIAEVKNCSNCGTELSMKTGIFVNGEKNKAYCKSCFKAIEIKGSPKGTDQNMKVNLPRGQPEIKTMKDGLLRVNLPR